MPVARASARFLDSTTDDAHSRPLFEWEALEPFLMGFSSQAISDAVGNLEKHFGATPAYLAHVRPFGCDEVSAAAPIQMRSVLCAILSRTRELLVARSAAPS